jgi:hypothetical protein
MEQCIVPQLEQAGAVAEPEVVETGPDNSQVETQSDPLSFYEDEQSKEPEQAPDDEPDSDEDDDSAEPEQEPAIDAPVSLKAEEKEQFAQLQPEAQRMLSEVLSRRDRETQQGLESARKAQRDAESSAADQVAQTQRSYADQFEQLVSAFAPQPPDPRLAQQDPGAYIAEKAMYDQQIGQFQQLVQQIGGIRQQADSHAQQQDQEWRASQARELMSIPEFADETQRVEFLTNVEGFATSEGGYSADEVAQAGAKDIVLLKKAMAWKADAEKWRNHIKRRNERPRESGKFARAAAPVGAGGQTGSNDILKTLYPND